MYLYDKNRITYFAETDRRNKKIPFGIKAEDRTRHMYIIGKTGMGKSTLIENMAVQDIKNGEGFAFIDPHGKSAALLLEYVPPERIKDVIYFAPFDMENPLAFNVMEDVGPDKRHLVANGLMSAFKKIWGPETWSARMEYILGNVLLALLEYPEATLLGVNRMLTDKAYRKKVVDNIKDPSVKTYWVDEFTKYSETYTKDATPAIQNKIGQFTSNPLIRNIVGQPHSSFDLRKLMDERKILIVNLSKGQLGEGNANLLGGMIITKLYLAAMSRADLSEAELKKLPNFAMYVDEFQSFANESFADILSEARKYKLSLVMAHQYIEQMDEKVRAAVFGNVGTQVMFRVGATDAEVLEKEYAPVFTAEDMVNLGFAQIYLKLMIDGVASHPFSATTLPPIIPPKQSSKDQVIASSRALYGKPRAEVEKSIADWYAQGQEPPREPRPTGEKRGDVPHHKEQKFEHPPRREERRQAPERREGGAPQAHPSRDDRRFDDRRKQPHLVETSDKQTEKPFAQAFKNIAVELPKPEPVAQSNEKMKLAELVQPKAGDKQKQKGPTQENLNTLKTALAGLVKQETSKQEKPPVPQSSSPDINTPRKVPIEKVTDLPKVEKPEPAKTVPESPREQVKNKSTETQQSYEPPRPREIPEDVLTAILRGDE